MMKILIAEDSSTNRARLFHLAGVVSRLSHSVANGA
jgi:hypothetical protein